MKRERKILKGAEGGNGEEGEKEGCSGKAVTDGWHCGAIAPHKKCRQDKTF